MDNKFKVFTFFTSLFRKTEDFILVSLLLIMISMAVLQIFLRNFFDSGIVWGDAMVRILVLWIGLIGAMAASRTDNHISIDIISRYLPLGIKRLTSLAVYIFTVIVTAAMAFFSARFVAMEKADQLMAFANVPAWICQLIIPVAFTVICLRYILFTINQFIRIFSKHP